MKKWMVLIACMVLLHAEHNYTNALVDEKSPYLQQHAHNPVHWYPWGEEAFEKAKIEQKLIFLSIGYSTCHWCHEMEQESFRDESVAKLLNDHYISIKVDREEYPQIDKKYQKLFLQRYGKRGGWPLSVFLSPNREVFHLATYIPKEEGYGSKGLMKLLPEFAALQKKPKVFNRRIDFYKKLAEEESKRQELKAGVLSQMIQQAVSEIAKTYDEQYGGFAFRPKYPEASKIELLLTAYRLSGDRDALKMAKETLHKMAQSGVYDQVEGGFFRYTTDEAWLNPHFEKMLYTNAEMIPVYVQMYLLTEDPVCKQVVEETIAHMEKHFTCEGLFLSASDADSDGEEGGYYIYDYLKVQEALLAEGWGKEEVEAVLNYYGIEEDGNVDGEFSHLHISSGTKPNRAEELKKYLQSVRQKRHFPFVDRKIITAWNAMMIKALFYAGKIDAKYTELGKKHLKKLFETMFRDGVLYHYTLPETVPVQKAILEDYAFLTDALIEGYEQTYHAEYLKYSEQLAKESIEKFYRKKQWYLSSSKIGVLADFDDRYYTSALSVMLESLLRLASLTEKRSYLKIVEESIAEHGGILETEPSKAPKLFQTYMRLKQGDVTIHAEKRVLQKAHKQIDSIRYPFVLSKAQEAEGYLACGIGQCFAQEKDIDKLIEKIEQMKKDQVGPLWQK
ncbi:thioredoxin domain-containing protein [Sulfurovum sp. ST-21]|uniref:Thioredoxin domain-containing protein n=1 Tax=Sulfurovum indicum TaxID=2779528 RepID=A0A7M1S4Y0_9BACT|nr:thioredoxin domain-containing protein [Sulfurovum indicum]QOR61789.1 thioredoxin domain-containing protein [Sulfurovum indicum]